MVQYWLENKLYLGVVAVVLLSHVLSLYLLSDITVTLKEPPKKPPIKVRFQVNPPKPKVVTPKPIKQTPKPIAKAITPKPVKPKPAKPKTVKPIPKKVPKKVIKPKPKPVKPKPIKKEIVKPKPVKSKPVKKEVPKPKPIEKPKAPTVPKQQKHIAADALAKEKALLQKQQEQKRLEEKQREQENQARLEQERLEKQRLENERIEKEKLEQERLERERLEKERLEKERLEKERMQAEAEAKKQADAKAKKEEQAQAQKDAKKQAGITKEASYLNEVVAKYPRKDERLGMAGEVSFKFVIGTNGKAKNIQTIQATNKRFERAAKKALKASTFNVTKINGEILEQKAKKTIKFVP